MQTLINLSAPPYHVQSSAEQLKGGFLYFAHHESVSKHARTITMEMGKLIGEVRDEVRLTAAILRYYATMPSGCSHRSRSIPALPGKRRSRPGRLGRSSASSRGTCLIISLCAWQRRTSRRATR